MDASLPNYSFGYLVRRYRQALDLTQTDLARQVGCALVTISKIERDERRPSRQMAGILAERLNIPAADRDLFIAAALGERAVDNLALETRPAEPPVAPVPTGNGHTPQRRHNLPAPTTRLVGRHNELDSVRSLLLRPDVRLLTLTGPAGTGKTRLSLEVATQVVDEFSDGVFFVPLASIAEPELVASMIADALGVGESSGRSLVAVLKEYLYEKQLLTVLDNLEHLLPSTPLILDLLTAAPALKVMATSQALLRVYGEHHYPVPPLTIPDPSAVRTAAHIGGCDACQLFIERARALDARFELTDSNASSIAGICSRVDGLPLAIELAAARIRMLPPHKILEQLSSRLTFLSRGAQRPLDRHQALRQTLDWSYNLLNEWEQVAFQGYALCAGGWSLETAEALGAAVDGLDAFTVLESLVDKSLARRVDLFDEPRFEMLETFREYGLEKLRDNPALPAIERAFAHYFLGLAEAAAPALRAHSEEFWLPRLEADLNNFRAVLRWAHERHEAECELKLAAALWRFWEIRGYFTEGRQRLEQALAVGAEANPDLLAEAHTGAGTMAWSQSDHAAAIAHHEAALALYRQLGNDEGIAFALNNLGAQAVDLGDLAAAERWLGESLAIAERIGDNRLVCYVLANQGDIAKQRSEYAQAAEILTKWLDLSVELGDSWMVAAALAWRGTVLLHMDARAQAADDLVTSLEHCVRIGARQYTAMALEGLAFLAALRTLPEACAQLGGAAETLRNEIGITLLPHAHQEHDASVAYVQSALSADAFAAAWAQGGALLREKSLVDAVKTLLNENEQSR